MFEGRLPRDTQYMNDPSVTVYASEWGKPLFEKTADTIYNNRDILEMFSKSKISLDKIKGILDEPSWFASPGINLKLKDSDAESPPPVEAWLEDCEKTLGKTMSTIWKHLPYPTFIPPEPKRPVKSKTLDGCEAAQRKKRVSSLMKKTHPTENIIECDFRRLHYDGQEFYFKFVTSPDWGVSLTHEVWMETGPNHSLIGYCEEFDFYVFCPVRPE